jgi:pimeloyl-ACP methyl ester carboxylesterase
MPGVTFEQAPRVSLTRRIARSTALLLVILALVLHGVAGWYFSTQIIESAFEVPVQWESDTEVVAIDQDGITLRSLDDDPDVGRNQAMGFVSDVGFLRLGEVVEQSGEAYTRSFDLVDGAVPVPGSLGRVTGVIHAADPSVSGLDLDIVSYDGPLGPQEAWVLDGSRSEWVIYVHGLGIGPEEALRLMGGLERSGYHQMSITYRNDPGQPQDPSGYYQYGREEWKEVEAAVAYARDNGATEVILVGYSTGAGIVVSYLYKTADDVAAAILDAPNLNMSATLDHGAAQEELPFGIQGVPRTIGATAKVIASLRASINWNAIDYANRIGQLAVPTLIIHGKDDDWTPIEVSRDVAAARPQFVTLVEVDGAGHVQAWNADPVSYERRVSDFIADALS